MAGASGHPSWGLTQRQSARVPGPLQVSRTPPSPAHRASADNKRLRSFRLHARSTPALTPEPKPPRWTHNTIFLPAPSSPRGQSPLPPLARGPQRSENPTLSGRPALRWPGREDEPRVPRRVGQLSVPSWSGAAPGVCAPRVGRLVARSQAVSGAKSGEGWRVRLLRQFPQGRAGPGRQGHRDKIKRRHHKARSARRLAP